LALAAVAASPALAQNRGAMMAERQQAFVDTVVVQLELDEEREKTFRGIMAEQLEGMQAIFEKYDGQREPAMRDEVVALRTTTTEKLETIFSKDEMARYNELAREHRERFRRGQQPPPQG